MSFVKINELGKKREPFLFISDFSKKNIQVIPLCELDNYDIEFCIDDDFKIVKHSKTFKAYPKSFFDYDEKFKKVIKKIKDGETYLLNLTQATQIQTKSSLKELYKFVNANFKLRYKNKFICFSPERFISIKNNQINTFPMKGTIDVSHLSIKSAKEKILRDKKEISEHTMIVDLLRNDLSMVSKDVKVDKFRYITKLKVGKKTLLQVSSHIFGKLDSSWHENLGNILSSLLPAGSISGTPKKSTIEIIDSIEDYERGYFSGVFGVYDGEKFDSGVMIRFIENSTNGLVYKSGGGITIDSNSKQEYQELLDKIYLP